MCDKDLTHSLDRPKTISIKISSEVVNHDEFGTQHDLQTLNSIHNITKAQERASYLERF